MKRSSVLDSLQELRKRSRESEEQRLADDTRALEAAEAREREARQELAEELDRCEIARESEKTRLESSGLRAADGQRQIAWERCALDRQRNLEESLRRASAARLQAASARERSTAALQRAQAALEQVETRLDRAQRARRREREQAHQETVDESSMRRFFGHRDA